MVFLQRPDHAGGDGFRGALVFFGKCLEEVIDQQPDVLAPLAQGRKVHPHHIEPVKQVLAELARGHRLLQRPVRRGDDADVHGNRLVAAHALERAGLQHPQDLGLGRRRHVADFIQEQRALVALLELADALQRRAGECAALVAE